jgi:hypothetical protein
MTYANRSPRSVESNSEDLSILEFSRGSYESFSAEWSAVNVTFRIPFKS